jgi:hypothetical protein
MATELTGATGTTDGRPVPASDGPSTPLAGEFDAPTRRARLAELAARIRALETGAQGPGAARRATTQRAARTPKAAADIPADAATELLGGLERGVLHELCGPGDGADWTPPLALLLGLCSAALGCSAPADATPLPGEPAADRAPPCVAFVGRRTWPHPAALVAPPVLVHAGDSRLLAWSSAGPVDPRLLDAALFVDTQSVVAPGQRGANAATRGLGAHVWAADRVLRARVSAVVVVDGRGLAIGEVRRLQLAAEAGGALVLLVRPAGDVERPSSAASRWSLEQLEHRERRVEWARDESAAHGALLVGWRVELRRRRRIGDGHGA